MQFRSNHCTTGTGTAALAKYMATNMRRHLKMKTLLPSIPLGVSDGVWPSAPFPPHQWLFVSSSCLPGVRVGLQQLWSGGFRLHSEPAHTPPSVQLPAEQSGCQHRVRPDFVSGSGGQRRGEPGTAPWFLCCFCSNHVVLVCPAGVRLGLQWQRPTRAWK